MRWTTLVFALPLTDDDRHVIDRAVFQARLRGRAWQTIRNDTTQHITVRLAVPAVSARVVDPSSILSPTAPSAVGASRA